LGQKLVARSRSIYHELHARSAFSFLEGSSLPEDLAAACVRLNMPSMALLDRDGVYGAPRFYMAAKRAGFKAHIGAEITCELDSDLPSFRLPLLISSRAGYQNLCRLITKTKLRANKNKPSAATFAELEEHAEGLVCLTGDENGPLAAALRTGNKREAKCLLDRLTSVFGRKNVYVELQRHFRPEQEHRNHKNTSHLRQNH
jgi:error-prone DNA polymerase